MKSVSEYMNIVNKCLDNPAEIAMQSLTHEEVTSMAVVLTIIQYKTKEIRDKLIEIRAQMDIPRQTMIPQTKQHLTNLIKELK